MGSRQQDAAGGITTRRLRAIAKRFFAHVAHLIEDQRAATALKLRRAGQ